MKSEKTKFSLAGLRRSDKIVLGVIAAMILLTVALSVMQRCGLPLINASFTLFLPVFALLTLLTGTGG